MWYIFNLVSQLDQSSRDLPFIYQLCYYLNEITAFIYDKDRIMRIPIGKIMVISNIELKEKDWSDK